jgi:hypothetical protein
MLGRKSSQTLGSGTLSAALRLVIVCGIEIDCAEGFENAKLLVVPDILRERCGDGLFLRFVAAGATG